MSSPTMTAGEAWQADVSRRKGQNNPFGLPTSSSPGADVSNAISEEGWQDLYDQVGLRGGGMPQPGLVMAANGISDPTQRRVVSDAGGGSWLELSGVGSPDSKEADYYDRIIEKAKERDAARWVETQRRQSWIANENAIGSRVQSALSASPIRMTETPVVPYDGGLLDIASPAFAGLDAPSASLQAMGVAVESVIRAAAEVPAWGVDLTQAAVGSLYTSMTGSAADLTMYSQLGRGAQNGAGIGDSLQSLNPAYGLMVGQYDVREGLARGDTRPLAAFSGSVLGGAAVGMGATRMPNYQPGPSLSGAAASRLREMGVPDWNIRLAQTRPGTLNANPLPFELERIAAQRGVGPLDPVLQVQKDISIATQRKAAVVDRWLRTSDNQLAQAYRDASNTNPNFASMIRGRVIDRRMNAWFKDNFGDVPGVRIDQQIPGSGVKTRPDLYLPNLDGQKVIFDVGGASKVTDILKYQGLADYLFPITH